MTEQKLYTHNWKNITFHLAAQFAAAWLFVFGMDRAVAFVGLANYGRQTSVPAFFSYMQFYSVVLALVIILYFLVYKQFKRKVDVWLVIGGMFLGIYSSFAVYSIIPYFFARLTANTIITIYIYIAYNLPLLIYLLSFTKKKVFLFALLTLLTIAAPVIPMLPLVISTILFGPII